VRLIAPLIRGTQNQFMEEQRGRCQGGMSKMVGRSSIDRALSRQHCSVLLARLSDTMPVGAERLGYPVTLKLEAA